MKKNKEEDNKEKKSSKKKNDNDCNVLLGERIKELEEKLIRNQAELQNYKRRKEEEISKMLKYANEDIAKDILTILDNFERAIKLDDNDLTDELSKFLEGFKMIYTSLRNVINSIDVTEIECLNKPFDANYHQAVMTDKDETKESGIILEVYQKGYMYKDRVIRPAMVKVNE